MRITQIRGDRGTFELALTDGATTPGTLDLTGRTVYFTAKRRVWDADEDAVIAKSSEPDGGITIDDDPTTGLATLVLLPEDTSELESWTRLVFDVELRDDADPTDVATVIQGTLIVTEDVRRGDLVGS